jgi:hypothetical protein
LPAWGVVSVIPSSVESAGDTPSCLVQVADPGRVWS